MDFQDKSNLYKVRNTVLEMIADRGYIVPQSENVSFEEFIIKYGNNNLNIYINDEFKKKQIYIYFHNEQKAFGKKDLLNLFQETITKYKDEYINLIILLKDKENSSIAKELGKEIYKNVEIFVKKYLIFNYSRHVYVPKHILLNEEEEKEVLEKYNTSKGKFPKISKSDPIAKYYGMQSNQICKIIRKSPEVGEYIYYRLVR